jgi:predicted permease
MANADAARINMLLDGITQKVGSLPGVESVGQTSAAYWQSEVIGSRPTYIFGAAEPVVMDFITISPTFLETMRIPLRNGRMPNVADLNVPSRVALINQAAAARLFSGSDPIGRRLGFSPQTAANFEIIGIVGDTKYGDVRSAVQPMVYLLGRPASWVVRTAGEPMQLASRIQQAVRAIEPKVPVTDIETMNDLGNARIQTQRLMAGFYGVFALLALLFASIGLFGMMSYDVARRRMEFGIRMALGAQRPQILTLIVRESTALLAIGLVVGLTLALVTNRIIAGQLYGLAPTDLRATAFATFTLTAVAALAASLPAYRACRIDPLRAIRNE